MVLTHEKVEFARWLCLPKRKRDPRTQDALATKLGIHPATLKRWKADPEFRDMLSEFALAGVFNALPGIFAAGIENMQKPSGWQERLGFERYVMPGLLATYSKGGFQHLKPGGLNQLPGQGRDILALFGSMGEEQRAGAEAVLDALGLDLDGESDANDSTEPKYTGVELDTDNDEYMQEDEEQTGRPGRPRKPKTRKGMPDTNT